MSDVTTILNAFSDDESAASRELMEVIYSELRKMAAGKMAGERSGHTLQATALVNEAFMRLAGTGQNWENRRHFFGAASEAMRRILIENARRQQAQKRDAGEHGSPANDLPRGEEKLLEVHEVLDALENEDPLRAEIVKLRFFLGLTVREIAELYQISERTVARHWDLAKIWLIRALREPS